MIIIVVLMYMDEEPNYSLESLNKTIIIIIIIIIISIIIIIQLERQWNLEEFFCSSKFALRGQPIWRNISIY